MTTITANLQAVRARIAAACSAAGRPESEVLLLAVSKTCPASALREAVLVGQMAFGESYVQEALPKLDALTDLAIEWHFIGPLQSNKTRAVAERFAWVHSVDRLKIAERLAVQRPAEWPPLNICLQVNVSGEASKSGCAPEQVLALAQAVSTLPNLHLRGLMAIPEPLPDNLPATEKSALAGRRFVLLHELRERINQAGIVLDTLSMGMSDDLEAAIMHGASIVRVGSAIFGERNYTS